MNEWAVAMAAIGRDADEWTAETCNHTASRGTAFIYRRVLLPLRVSAWRRMRPGQLSAAG
jgi:hypothetical protein